MTNEEYDRGNRETIKLMEEHVADYKKLLEQMGRDRATWPPDAEHTMWYKDMLRTGKSHCEWLLSHTQEAQRKHKVEMNTLETWLRLRQDKEAN